MAALFIQYQRLLYKEIYDILKNPWNTEDVLQATLVKLIDKLPELRNKERPQLDAKSKYLLEGKYILGKSDEALAEELSIKPASVRMALTRARQCAYQLLTKEQTPSRS